uniref:Uncharacterized protein n=1 Tax=Oryza meridionalis TaxID=40149 RepID=A0A0E0F995_9ORYZ
MARHTANTPSCLHPTGQHVGNQLATKSINAKGLYYNSMFFLLPPILYMSYHLTRNFTEKKLAYNPWPQGAPAARSPPGPYCFLDWTTELIVGSPEMTVLSFLIAGRETTASGLSWFFWLLSSRPHVVRGNMTDSA